VAPQRAPPENTRRMRAHLPCSRLVDGLYVACTSHVPRMYLACTSQSPPNHLACTWLVPRMYLALGGFARLFCILHSSFCLPPAVALGSHWGGFEVALGWLWSSLGVALGCLSVGYQQALGWLWEPLPPFHHSSFFILPSLQGGSARPFCIHHSSFCLRPAVALGGFGLLHTPGSRTSKKRPFLARFLVRAE
jgi:hypothetical protein